MSCQKCGGEHSAMACDDSIEQELRDPAVKQRIERGVEDGIGHCGDCVPDFNECWNDGSKCRKRLGSRLSDMGTLEQNIEMAIIGIGKTREDAAQNAIASLGRTIANLAELIA